MNKQKARETTEREHAVGAARCILEISNMSLNAGNVFICRGGVEKRERIAERFEFRVSKDGGDTETTMFIETNDFGEPLSDVPNLSVWKTLNGGI